MTEAERQAFNRGVAVAVGVVKLWAHENAAMAQDTMMLDPIMNGRVTEKSVEEDYRMSQQLSVEGHGYAAVAHACTLIAKMIEDQRLPKRNV